MTRTYIYGIPRGFNFYEGEPDLIDYFKSYYIADRRGRRLEIDRRDNGETFYNYLRYGLAEVSRTPQNAFWGMTLVLGDGKYIADIKTLIEFMDLLFSKLVERDTILAPDPNGVLRYKIDRFDRVVDDVNWIKGNLPNILKRLAPQDYDSSFVQCEVGKIATFKSDVSNGHVLAAMRKYKWVSICANITEQDTTLDPEPEEEVDVFYLVSWLNSTNQKLVPIAITPTLDSLPKLKDWRDTATRHLESLVQQMNKLKAGVVYDNLRSVGQNLNQLRKQMIVLINKLSSTIPPPPGSPAPSDPPKPPESTRNCLNCQRTLPESEFSSHDAIICRDCESKLPVGGDGNGGNGSGGKTGSFLKWLLFGVAIIIIVVLGVLFLPKTCSNNQNGSGGVDSVVENEEEKVISETLVRALANRDFQEVYKQLDGSVDCQKYIGQVTDTIDCYMWTCVAKTQKTAIEQFWSEENANLLQILKLPQDKKTEWIDFYNDYQDIQTALSKAKISQEEYDELCVKIDKHVALITKKKTTLPDTWKSGLQSKIESTRVEQPKIASSFIVTYKDQDDKQQTITVENKSTEKNNSFKVLENTQVTITASNGVFQGGNNDGKTSVTITMGAYDTTSKRVRCSNLLTIFLEPKKGHIKV